MSTILIVDDSITSRKVLKNILESDGHTIVGEAVNGEEGVNMYAEHKPDVVTLDITMPVMDGIEALQKIMELNPDAKVVMVTAVGQKSKMVEAIKYGAADFVAKPFEPGHITEVIRHVATT